jgi:hypothetical protein
MERCGLFSCRAWLFLAGIVFWFSVAGCLRDKYDFDKLSTQVHVSQELVMPVVYGTMKVENMAEPNDTLVFDPDGGVRLVYREDSIFVQDLADLIELDDQDPDSTHFGLGPFRISDATASIGLPNAAGTYDLDTLPGFHWVEADTGSVEVTVQNHLSVEVTSLTLRLRNRSDNTVVGEELTFTNIASGGSSTLSMDLTGVRITNELAVEVVSVSPVVPLQNDAFTITVHTHDVEAGAGNAILPEQFLYVDTGIYKLEEDTLQITYLAFSRGVFEMSVRTNFPEDVELEVVFPAARKDGDTLRYRYAVTGGVMDDSLLLDHTLFDLSTDPTQPYNALPYRYVVTMKNAGKYVDFSRDDQFFFRYRLRELTMEYVEGYFGEDEYSFDRDTIETGLDDLFSRIHGTLSLADPQIRILYSNGFGIPVEILTDVTGINGDGQEQALNAPPMRMEHPAGREDPPVEGALEYTRDNTDIVPLIELRPLTIVYGGKARMNPDGFQGWNNFISASSTLVVGLEVEVPLEFRMQDLVLLDTLANPFQSEENDTSGFSLQDLDYLLLHLGADNGFPLDLSIRMYMYDSLTHVVQDSVIFGKIVEAAPVDAGGRVTGTVKTTQHIRIEGSQLEHLEEVNSLILRVTFNTSGGGSQYVKIYTDYSLGFHLAAATTLDYDLDTGE